MDTRNVELVPCRNPLRNDPRHLALYDALKAAIAAAQVYAAADDLLKADTVHDVRSDVEGCMWTLETLFLMVADCLMMEDPFLPTAAPVKPAKQTADKPMPRSQNYWEPQ